MTAATATAKRYLNVTEDMLAAEVALLDEGAQEDWHRASKRTYDVVPWKSDWDSNVDGRLYVDTPFGEITISAGIDRRRGFPQPYLRFAVRATVDFGKQRYLVTPAFEYRIVRTKAGHTSFTGGLDYGSVKNGATRQADYDLRTAVRVWVFATLANFGEELRDVYASQGHNLMLAKQIDDLKQQIADLESQML